MGKYVDGFILVVPKGKESEYEDMARQGRDSWMRHGALQYFECRGEDLRPQEMGDQRSRSFPEVVGATGDENIWFSFIVFESRQHRDEVNQKVNDEMGETYAGQTEFVMPFDPSQTIYGGFEVVVEG